MRSSLIRKIRASHATTSKAARCSSRKHSRVLTRRGEQRIAMDAVVPNRKRRRSDLIVRARRDDPKRQGPLLHWIESPDYGGAKPQSPQPARSSPEDTDDGPELDTAA
jgi:hypothetical protein